MKKQILVTLMVSVVFLLGAGGIAAQGHKQHKKMAGGMSMDMTAMKNSPHHKLMMAYMRDMSQFARMLRDQALTPKGPDAEFARAAVGELRHDLDAMESIHQKHMEAMDPAMKEKIAMMMDKMDKGQAMVKEHVTALETAVQADQPDAKEVAMHANDLVKHFGMMSGMGHKMAAKKKMPMKKKTATMKPM
jgi:hypothetical protein